MTEETPRLSPSIAQKGLDESTLAMWAGHRLLGGFKKAPSDSQIEGRMWHSALLEASHDVVRCDYDSFRTNEAKAAKAEILAQGKIPVIGEKLDALRPAADRITEELYRRGWDLNADTDKHEVRLEWTELSSAGAEVLCSGYADSIETLKIREIKTGKTGVSEHAAKALIARSYSLLQGTAYPNALAQMAGIDRARIEMEFWFIQTVEPYQVSWFTFGGTMQEAADLRWQRAIDMWADCLEKGMGREAWEPTLTYPARLEAPGWLINGELELEAMNDA